MASTKTFTIVYHKTSSSSISDLTGTKWVFNDEIDIFSFNASYAINFISNNTNYMYILRGTNSLIYSKDDINRTYVYDSGQEPPFIAGWSDNAYKTIEITGGADATNSDLIALLEANATQIIETQPFSVVKFNNLTLGRINNHYIRSLNGVGVRSGKSSSVSLILFTIGSRSYQAEEGMTWEEWCDSEYNTDGFSITGDYILDPKYGAFQERYVYYNRDYVLKTATIVPNGAYTSVL